MVEIEKYTCDDGNEARARERYWVESLNAKLNRCIPNRKHKEWVNDNLEVQIEKRKEYYQTNVNHLIEERLQPQ
jgi:acyl-ACP thioesterase